MWPDPQHKDKTFFLAWIEGQAFVEGAAGISTKLGAV